jgi:glucan phosphoethanolaminetransferase (alkaline phosphatase superfamily)
MQSPRTSTATTRAALGAALLFGALALTNALPTAAVGDAGLLPTLEHFAFGVAFFAVWLAVIGRIWPAVLLAALLFAWWWPAELYLRWAYAAPLSPQFVGLSLETHRREFIEFLHTFWRELALGLVLLAAVAGGALALTWRSSARWTHRSRWWCLVLFPLVGLVQYQVFEMQEPADLGATPDPLRVAPLSFWSEKWREVFPLTLPLALQRYYEDATRVAQLRKQVAGYRFGAVNARPPLDAVVLVIGESSRADRWSLDGYARDTNPLLARRANLVFLPDVVTPAVSTRLAVPSIVAREPVLTPVGHSNPRAEPSLVAAFGEAGYRTAWLSTQGASGFWDTSSAFYARDAQVVRFLNPTAAAYRGNHDDVLLQPLQEFVQAGGPAMVVLHTLGSHFDYAQRYPKAFERFGTARPDAYDNTILYTDWFLDAVMQRLNQPGRRSLVFYISDHGEDLQQSGCDRTGVTRMGRWSYRVPALAWMSDTLAAERPGDLESLRAAARQPHQSAQTFQTVLDLAGIRLARGTPAASMLSAPAPGAPRMVADSNGTWVDYDRAARSDPCHISATAAARPRPVTAP